jgi:SAM-dependent methyltransferase
MNDFGSNFWDERFSVEEYVYGVEPNRFFKEQLDKVSPGRILLLGEGEGRNAVYAAKNGWEVNAVDYSQTARKKATELAEKCGVVINYEIQDLQNFIPDKNLYNAVAAIFLHIVPAKRRQLHKNIILSLVGGGIVIIEVFEKDQLGKSTGGPQNFDMLYSIEEIESDFAELKVVTLKKEFILLDEGDKHRGEASVVRYVGKKYK